MFYTAWATLRLASCLGLGSSVGRFVSLQRPMDGEMAYLPR